jgi:hypothetical protein
MSEETTARASSYGAAADDETLFGEFGITSEAVATAARESLRDNSVNAL